MDGAQERTRTFTAVKPLAPEASASTNSTTWALEAVTKDRPGGCQISDSPARPLIPTPFSPRYSTRIFAPAALYSAARLAYREMAKQLRGTPISGGFRISP